MKIFFGADHGGFELKKELLKWCQERFSDYQVEDCGAFELNSEDDYPDFAFAVGQKVVLAGENAAKGILLCRSGGGMVIAANKVGGVRAIETFDIKSAKHACQHNNANVIALAADWMDLEQMKQIIEVFLQTDFSNEPRHVRRINKISEFETKK